MQWLQDTSPLPHKALACVESRSPRTCSSAALGGWGCLFYKLLELSTACPLPSMLVRHPAWFSEAMLMPYVHATEASYCLSRGTQHKEEHIVFIAGWLLILPQETPGSKRGCLRSLGRCQQGKMFPATQFRMSARQREGSKSLITEFWYKRKN